jgi:hypothetical protein
MARPLSKLAPAWWDYTTLDTEIIEDAARGQVQEPTAQSGRVSPTRNPAGQTAPRDRHPERAHVGRRQRVKGDTNAHVKGEGGSCLGHAREAKQETLSHSSRISLNGEKSDMFSARTIPLCGSSLRH